MAEWTTPMAWNGTCTEPPSALKESGYIGGDNPCAEHENFFRNRTAACITELQNEFENYTQTRETLTAIIQEEFDSCAQTTGTIAAIVRQYVANQADAVAFTKDDGGNLYYYDESGNMASGGVYYIGGIPYMFADNGMLEVYWQTVHGLRYYYDGATGQLQTGFIEYQGNTYYVTLAEGKYVSRTAFIDGVTYTFDESGICTSIIA